MLKSEMKTTVKETEEQIKQQTKDIADLISSKISEQNKLIKQRFTENRKEIEKEVVGNLQAEWAANMNVVKLQWASETRQIQQNLEQSANKWTQAFARQEKLASELKTVTEHLPERASKRVGLIVKDSLMKSQLINRPSLRPGASGKRCTGINPKNRPSLIPGTPGRRTGITASQTQMFDFMEADNQPSTSDSNKNSENAQHEA